MLGGTLVVWGEFGRTPTVDPASVGKKAGRDQPPRAHDARGGGVKGGYAHGGTDEFGFQAVGKPAHVHDLHATILHLLGLDHKKLTHRYAGRDFRLTDVSGKAVTEVIA